MGLPAEVDTASTAIKATYDNGIVMITLPKLRKPEARQIKVEAKPGRHNLDRPPPPADCLQPGEARC